jgi:hypothetical protein
MGGNSSKTAAKQTQEFFNQTTNSFMDSHNQTVNASAFGVNTINLQGADLSGCRTYLSQNIDTSVSATGELRAESIGALTSTLQNAASQKIDQLAQQKNGFLATGVANSTTATSDLKTTVTNIINNTMQSSTVQNIISTANNLNVANNQGLKASCDPAYKTSGPCGPSGQDGCDFVIDQKLKQTVVAKGISDSITKALFANSVVNSAVQAGSQKADQTSGGIAEAISAWFQGISGIFGIIACIVICVCLAILAFALSPAGQKATTNASGAGAAYAAKH